MKKLLWTIPLLASAGFMGASLTHHVSLNAWEVFGFITGGYCVWLVVLENIWNWPIGIINAVAFLVLFTSSKLYADAGLQAVYVVLNALGWYWWLHGGKHKSKLKIGHIGLIETAILAGLGVVATILFSRFLKSVGDVAPFLDALTTVSSLIAQYMLTRKYLENWYVWIATDIIYIGLYAAKHLILTGVLYAVFLTMCCVGVHDWRRSSKQVTKPAAELGLQGV
jgi:nicotinamide mononucleotide transporter